MASYYILRDSGAPEGPIRKSEICRMVSSGELGPDDQVSPAIGGPWMRVSKVPQLSVLLPGPSGAGVGVTPSWDPPSGWASPGRDAPHGDGPPSGGPRSGGGPPGGPPSGGTPGGSFESDPPEEPDDDAAYLIPARIVESVLGVFQQIADSGLLEAISRRSLFAGHVGLLIGGVAATVLAVVVAIRLDSLRVGALVLVAPVAVAVLQYGAWKFLALCQKTVRNTPTRTSSLAVYQLVALLLLLAAGGGVVVALYYLIDEGLQDVGPVTLAILGGSSYLSVVALLFLTPRALNLHVDETCSAGEDGIGIVGTFLKATLAASRIVFGTACFIGGCLAVIGTLIVLSDRAGAGMLWFAVGSNLVAVGALNAVVVYLISAIYYILPDLITGVIRHVKR